MDDLVFGLQVTILGMGIVFGLLTLLWAAADARPAVRAPRRGPRGGRAPRPRGRRRRLPGPGGDVAPEAPAPASTVAPGSVRLVGAPADLDPALVAAIGVVILRHTEMRRRQAAPAMRSYWPGSLLFASRWVASGRTRQTRSWTRRAR